LLYFIYEKNYEIMNSIYYEKVVRGHGCMGASWARVERELKGIKLKGFKEFLEKRKIMHFTHKSSRSHVIVRSREERARRALGASWERGGSE